MSAACNFSIPQYQCTLETCCISEQAALSYRPTIVGNSIYLGLFSALLLAQLLLVALRYRSTWGFFIGIACGLILEIAGYIGRVLIYENPFDLNNFIIYLVCLTIGPAFLMAGIYIATGRVVVAIGAEHSRIAPRWYMILCVTGDLISLILQAAGGALAATGAKSGSQATPTDGQSESDAHDQTLTGTHILVAGLAFQLFSTLLFTALVTDFGLRVRKAHRSGNYGSSYSSSSSSSSDPAIRALVASTRFRLFLAALALATLLIFIRSVFRVAELYDGFSSSIANNQTLFMVFEGPMIIAAVLLLTIFHPGFSFKGLYGAADWKLGGSSSSSSKNKSRKVDEQSELRDLRREARGHESVKSGGSGYTSSERFGVAA